MKIFPTVLAIYESESTVGELTLQISQHLTESKSRPSSSVKPSFQGVVIKNTFQLTKYPRTPKGINPVAHGTIKLQEGRSRITVEFRLPAIIKAFFTIWFSGTSIGAIVSIYIISTESKYTDFFLYIPIGMILFGYFLAKKILTTEMFDMKQRLSKTFRFQQTNT